jgi:hypothetical protein
VINLEAIGLSSLGFIMSVDFGEKEKKIWGEQELWCLGFELTYSYFPSLVRNSISVSRDSRYCVNFLEFKIIFPYLSSWKEALNGINRCGEPRIITRDETEAQTGRTPEGQAVGWLLHSVHFYSTTSPSTPTNFPTSALVRKFLHPPAPTPLLILLPAQLCSPENQQYIHLRSQAQSLEKVAFHQRRALP